MTKLIEWSMAYVATYEIPSSRGGQSFLIRRQLQKLRIAATDSFEVSLQPVDSWIAK